MIRKILFLLDRRERWKLAMLLAMAVVSGLVQVVGVGSIMPFMAVLTDPELIQEQLLLRWAHALFGAPSTNRFLLILGTGVLAAFVLSNALVAFTQWYTYRFARWNQYRISRRLLEAYLSRPYVYHLQHNSANAGRNILVETQTFTQSVLVPGLQAVTYAISVLLVAGFLVWLSPVVAAIAVGIIGGAYGLVYMSLRRRLHRLGGQRLEANVGRFKAANEAFGAIKEVKASGKEAAFLARFDPDAKRFAKALASQQAMSQLPRHLVEVVAMGSVLLVVLLLLSAGQTATSIVPMVSVYALAGHRLFPAFQHIYAAASQLRTHAPVLDELGAEISQLASTPSSAIARLHPSERFPFVQAIELRDVCFTYPGRDDAALKDVWLTIPHGAAVALVGETGAGKTTLADVLLGLLRPQEGQILVDGTVLDEHNLRRWRREIGYVPQHIYLADDTVANNIAFGMSPQEVDREAVERAGRIANIHDYIVGDLPSGYDTVVGERGVRLSGGQRQRIGIARALYQDPEVLVLDEATSALDNATEAAVQTAIHQVAEAKTLIVIAHRLTTISECEIVCLMARGRIVAVGSYDTIIQPSATETAEPSIQSIESIRRRA